MIRKRAIVHGQVQGVGFRYNARAEAAKLGVHGFARNLADGSVEVELEGEQAAVTRMLDWLTSGFKYAIVSRVDVADLEPTGEDGFTIVR